MIFSNVINLHGIKYTIIRNENVLSEQIGLSNTDSSGKKYIGFMPNADIRINDQLINPAGEKVYVINTQTQFLDQEPQQLKAYYQTEYEYNNSVVASGTVFNINTVSNSVIGNNNIATLNNQQLLSEIKAKAENCEEDREELHQIVSLLELIADGKIEPKKGILSKFSALMEKHSWLTSSICGFILSFLTSQIP